MILTTEEKAELDTLFRLVDEAVVLRNQRVRADRELAQLQSQVASLQSAYEMAAMRVEQQRTKMTLAAGARIRFQSGVDGSPNQRLPTR